MYLSPQKYKLFSNFPHSFSTTSPTTLFRPAESRILRKNAEGYQAKSRILRKNAEGYHDQSHILRKNAEGYHDQSHILRKNAEGYRAESHILRKNAEGYRAGGRNRRWRVYQLRRHTDVRAEILFVYQKRIPIFVVLFGAWAGRLGTGLQNQVERFNSARHLRNAFQMCGRRFLIFHPRHRQGHAALKRITLHRRLRVTATFVKNRVNTPPEVEGCGGKEV